MSQYNKPSQGTHFSDGVRTGPLFTSKWAPGAGAFTPAAMVSSPVDSQASGIYNTPTAILDIVPAAVNAGALFGATAATIASAGNITLNSSNNANIQVIPSYQGVSNVIRLDAARNITIANTTNTAQVAFTIYGWDIYGMPMAETITASGAINTTIYGQKAFRYIRVVFAASGTAGGTIAVGVGNTFGLPYFLADSTYITSGAVNGSSNVVLGTLTPLTITTGNVSSTVSLNLTSSYGYLSFITPGMQINVTGGGGAYNGITSGNITGTFTLTAVTFTAPNVTNLFFVSGGTSGASAGTIAVSSTTLTLVTPVQAIPASGIKQADQNTATATTGDVRGTVNPATSKAGVDGTDRITVVYYASGADGRKYNASITASQYPRYLNSNPFTTSGTNGVITVFAAAHGFVTGDSVTFSGAVVGGIAGITAAQLNVSSAVTVLTNDTFQYQSGATAGATNGQAGGGTAVVMSPSQGTLYQNPICYFGVPQYAPSTIL